MPLWRAGRHATNWRRAQRAATTLIDASVRCLGWFRRARRHDRPRPAGTRKDRPGEARKQTAKRAGFRAGGGGGGVLTVATDTRRRPSDAGDRDEAEPRTFRTAVAVSLSRCVDWVEPVREGAVFFPGAEEGRLRVSCVRYSVGFNPGWGTFQDGSEILSGEILEDLNALVIAAGRLGDHVLEAAYHFPTSVRRGCRQELSPPPSECQAELSTLQCQYSFIETGGIP